MGMYGEWLRVSPSELVRAKGDLNWVRTLAEEIAETEYAYSDGRDLANRRSFGTDKTWHALDYLLNRRGFPISIIFGEEPFVEDPEDPEADWGYAAPLYLTPEQVQQAAVALAELTEDELIDGVDPADLQRDEIYPSVWDRPDELQWAVSHLPHVKAYFDAAAKAGDAIICWIG